MKLPRYYQLEKYVSSGKVLLLLGPRQIGKTTLANDYVKASQLKSLVVSGDSLSVQQTFGSQELATLAAAVEGYELLVIDEAQRIANIGWSLKILVDALPHLAIIATGSSSFELVGQVGEPLTGRKTTLTLFPMAELELGMQANAHERSASLPERLVYGGYPAVITTTTQAAKKELLRELLNSYLLKDILELEQVKSTKLLLDLLRLLAFQVGSEVSLSELAGQLQINVRTVARYLDLFEKSYIIFSLRGYSRNLRKEVTKKAKYYFYDLGMRNAVIENFNDIQIRNDVGQLWENYVFMERKKYREYKHQPANEFFWRTWTGQEIDLIEERAGELHGYESKWSDKSAKPPTDWQKTYPTATWKQIGPKNYHDFVG